MYLVVPTVSNTIEVNFSWLPTWIGLNQSLIRSIDDALKANFSGVTLTEETLIAMHCFVVDYLVKAYPHINGLALLLEATKHIDLT